MSVEGLIEIEQGRHTVLEGLTYRPVEFELKIISKAPVPLTVERFSISIKYEGVPIQVIQWQKGDKLASNGLEPTVHDLEALETGRLFIKFNPVLSPVGLPPKANRWAIEGAIYLSDPNNEPTVKRFELWHVQVSDESAWKYHRQQYQEYIERTLEG